MQRRIVRFLLIFGIIYASLFGGVTDHHPLMRIGHQVIAMIIFGVWLINLWRSGRAFPVTPLDAPLFAAGIFWVIAALFARDPRTSLEYTWTIWVHILLFYLFVDLMRRSLTMQRWIMEGVFITAALVVLITGVEMAAWYFGLEVLPQFSQSWPELAGFTIPPVMHEAAVALNYNNPTAAYCLLVIPLALAGSITLSRRDFIWALRAIAGGLVIVVLATQSRGGLSGLAMLLGVVALLWLLRPDIRARVPALLRPLLAPRSLLPAAILVAVMGLGVGLWRFMINPAHPVSEDVSRIDLWFSALEIFNDHPVVGVGPRQFASSRLWYGHWQASYSNLPLQHAHNLYLNWLAEGGTVGIAAGLWLVVRFIRVWWRMWRAADTARHRRLEGVLAGLIAFATHSLVDTFLQTQLMTTVIIMVAYVVAGGSPYDSHNLQRDSPPRFRRRITGTALAVLLIVQIVFVPVHYALGAHHQTLQALAGDDPNSLLSALAHNRTAQRFDPWQTVYVLQEATIRGRLAALDPAAYLDSAIAAHEDALRLNEAWAQGWFNLSALYAEAGRYGDAVEAVQIALAWDPIPPRYYFQLGQYHLAAGNDPRAYDAFFKALQFDPSIAASDIWHEPAHAPILDAVRANVAGTSLAFDLALYAGDLDTALQLARLPNASPGLRARRELIWPEDSAAPCPTCYVASRATSIPEANADLVRAERLLTSDAPAAERAARLALFLDEGRAEWGWYVLARLALRGDLATSDDQIDAWLAQSVSLPGNYNERFSTTFYNLIADLDILPQAQTPRLSSQAYAPWLLLAERRAARAEWDGAQAIYDRLRVFAPYDRALNHPIRRDGVPVR